MRRTQNVPTTKTSCSLIGPATQEQMKTVTLNPLCIASVRQQESDWRCVRFPVVWAEYEYWNCVARLRGSDWTIPRYRPRLQNDTSFSSAPRISGANSRPTPSSVIYHLLSKMQKMSQSFSNNVNSLNTTVNNFTVADSRSNILAWLSPLNPKLRHQDIQGQRVEKLGEWLFQTEEFRGWNAGSGKGELDNTVLFCYGDPGVGKTFIR